ncbi:MAG: YjiH family protein [Anaerovoracaceae bacterium]|jgi:nucleoside recognition membrane protein YjiH
MKGSIMDKAALHETATSNIEVSNVMMQNTALNENTLDRSWTDGTAAKKIDFDEDSNTGETVSDDGFKKIPMTKKNLLSFVIPAAIGAFIFLCPISVQGQKGIVVGIILSKAADAVIKWTPYIAVTLMIATAIATVLCELLKPSFVTSKPKLKKIFMPGKLEVALRIIGAALAVMALFKLGTKMIYSADTGGTMLELCADIMVWFIVASFFIPFLLDFGLMEFIGTLCRGAARPLLHIPGRSMIDVITSFVGDQNLGIMITNDQYTHGYYTGKEAVIISTCFSATGISYWYIISTILHVEEYFLPIVATMFITAFVSSVVMVRVWPIRSFSSTYFTDIKKNREDNKPADMSTPEFAVQLAMQKAQNFQGLKSMAQRSVDFCSSVVFAVLPVVMVIGTAGLVIATYTPIFDWLATPFKYYLQLLQIPDAAQAAPTTVAGFADMLIPSLIGAGIASAKTRFIICVLSLVQIIYMSEVGPILLMSEIPVKFWHLVVLFIEKTIIALPIITLCSILFQIPA